MFAGILCSSFNNGSWQAFIQSAGIKNVQTRYNYILNKDKYLSWKNNFNISNILHLRHLTWSHDTCPNPPVYVCTCAGHYNSFYSKICWLYGPASLFFPGRWNTNTRKWLPNLKIILVIHFPGIEKVPLLAAKISSSVAISEWWAQEHQSASF